MNDNHVATRQPKQLKKYFNAFELELITTLLCLGGYVENKVIGLIPNTSLYNQKEQRHLLAASYHLSAANYELLSRMDKTQIQRAVKTLAECDLVSLPKGDIKKVREELRRLDKLQTIDRALLEELYVGISGATCQGCTIKDHHRCKLKKALIMADAPMYDEYATDRCGYAFDGNTDREEFLLEVLEDEDTKDI